jgi:hypothetical protein
MKLNIELNIEVVRLLLILFPAFLFIETFILLEVKFLGFDFSVITNLCEQCSQALI